MEIRSSELGASDGYSSLGSHDRARLKAFFLSLDFDQRRSYFGGCLCDQAIADFCEAIDWSRTTVVAHAASHWLDAVAFIASIPPDYETAELSMACSIRCNRSTTASNLFDFATAIASPRRELIIHRELAMPELIHLVRERGIGMFTADEIRIRSR
jgi:hypothetical protein